MKFFAFTLLALLALTTGRDIDERSNRISRSISSQIVDAIESFKERMPCGFPGLGLGPLSPARLSHREIAINNDAIDLEGEIDNFILYGLDNFDIVEFRTQTIRSRVIFNFHWHNVNFETIYRFLLRQKNGFGLALNFNGAAKFAIKDLKIWGIATYSLGLVGSGGVRVKEFNVQVSIGEVKSDIEGLSSIGIINRKLNEIIEEWIMLAINDNTENFPDLANEHIVPLLNDIIGDRTITDLIGIIGGGGDGEPVEKEPCVPDADVF